MCEEKCSNENYPIEYSKDRIKATKIYKIAYHNTMLKEIV